MLSLLPKYSTTGNFIYTRMLSCIKLAKPRYRSHSQKPHILLYIHSPTNIQAAIQPDLRVLLFRRA